MCRPDPGDTANGRGVRRAARLEAVGPVYPLGPPLTGQLIGSWRGCPSRGPSVRLTLASREVWSAFRGCAMKRPGFFHSASGRRAGSSPWRARGLLARLPRVPDQGRLAGVRRDHPLARATEAVRCTGRQWNHVAAELAGSVIARAEGGRWASGLVCSAGGVLVVLSLLLAVRVQARRDCVIDVILGGGEDLPVPIVQRARRRLVSSRNRVGLAESLEEIAREAAAPRTGRVRIVPSLFEPRVVAQVADELLQLSAELRTGHVSARGVASLERLVSYATSPLYGRDVAALRGELRRVRGLLEESAE